MKLIKHKLFIKSMLLCPVMIINILFGSSFSYNLKVNAVADVEVWSAQSTEKILKEKSYDGTQKGLAAINISMAKSESESTQIIMTAAEDISSYKLTVTDLVSGNNTLSAEKITVYNQRYIKILSKSRTGGELGWWPDALIPMENAIQKAENKITAGSNQGIWIKVTTNSQTVAGDYTGVFVLNIDGTKINIPVKVTVWDFDIGGEQWPETAFLLYNDYLIQSEFDASYDMWVNYFEYFLDYGIAIGVPMKSGDIDSYVDNVKKYYSKISTYPLPYSSTYFTYPGNYFRPGPDFENLEITIKKLVAASIEDGIDYLGKAHIYNLYIDEYNASAYGQERIKLANVFAEQFTNTLKNVEDYFNGVYGIAYLDTLDGLRNSLLHVKNLSVSGYIEGLTEKYNTFVPAWGYFHIDELREQFSSIWKQENMNLWWYHCLGFPTEPSYLIDDSLVDERLASWMQYDYGVEGNLYWAVNYHRNKTTQLPDDEWENAGRSTNNRYNGDGWITYPGEIYGVKGPIGTIRLEAIRDGMEEYRYLKHLEKLYDELSLYYGTDVTTRAAMQNAYDNLYLGVSYNRDIKEFANQREALAQYILMAKSSAKIGFTAYEETSEGFNYELVSSSASPITSDLLTGSENIQNGVKYSLYSQKSTEDSILQLNYSVNGIQKNFTKFLRKAILPLLGFDQASHATHIRVSGSQGTAVGTIAYKSGKNGLGINLKGYVGNDAVTKSAYFNMLTSAIASVKDNAESYYLEIFNDGNEDIDIIVNQINPLYDRVLLSVNLKAGQWTQIKLSNLSNAQEMIAFSFVMPKIAGKNFNLYISSLRYSE